MTPARMPLHDCVAHDTHALCVGVDTWRDTIHQATQSVSIFSDLLVYDNCYRISCHALAWSEAVILWSQGVLRCRCTLSPNCPMSDTPQRSCDHKYPTPPILLVTLPREFGARTSKYIWNIFLQSPVKRHGQRITCVVICETNLIGSLDNENTILYLSSVTDSFLSLPLGWERYKTLLCNT